MGGPNKVRGVGKNPKIKRGDIYLAPESTRFFIRNMPVTNIRLKLGKNEGTFKKVD